MTTIAYRDGVMAGDSRETHEEEARSPMIVRDNCTKVWRLPDGRLFGASAGSEDIERLRLAMERNHPPPKLDDVCGLLVDLKRRIWLYEGNIWQRINMPFYAIGSGSVYAVPALKAGASAVKAVRISITCDPYSGGRVHSVSLKRAKR